MNVKRPIILFFIAFTIGIVMAYKSFSVIDKCIFLSVAVFFILLLYLNKKIKYRILILLTVFFVFGSVRFELEKKYFDDIDKKIEMLNNKKQEVEGVVNKIGKSTNSNYVILKNTKIYDKDYGNIRCYFSDDIEVNLKIGNKIKAIGTVRENTPPMNFGEFNSKNYYRSIKESGNMYASQIEIVSSDINWIKQGIYELKIKVIENIYSIFYGDYAGLFTAILTGDRSGLSLNMKKLFSDNGIAHIIAISGLHLSILGMLLYEMLRKKLSVRVSAFIVSIVILFYAIFIDASYITMRAIIMLYIRFLSLSINRTYDSKNVLFIIALFYLIISPYLLFNAGFLFSYTAVYSLNTEYKFEIGPKKIKIPQVIILTLFLFPITIYNYFKYPTYSILLNLIVIPLMTVVLGVGILGLMFSFINIIIGRFFSGIVYYIFLLYENLCNFINEIPYNNILTGKPKFTIVLIYYILIIFIYLIIDNSYEISTYINKKLKGIVNIKKILMPMTFLFILVSIVLCIRIRKGFKYTTLYIGQGDSIVLYNENKVITIDGGSTTNRSAGQYVLVPHIKACGIDFIDCAFITHADSDHTSCIKYILKECEDINIGKLVLPIMAKMNTKYDEIKNLAENRNTEILYMKEGDYTSVGNVIDIYCLSPIEGDELSESDINEQSLCLKFVYDGVSLLFTGDMGIKSEEKIIKNKNLRDYLKSDILKVGHHGSRGSTSDDFLKMVNPSVSVISCGINNSYKHPHKEVIDKLNKIDTKILKTTDSGEIDIYIENGKYRVEEFVKK